MQFLPRAQVNSDYFNVLSTVRPVEYDVLCHSPPSSTTLSLKNSGSTGAIQPKTGFAVTFIGLSKSLPLPAETGRGGRFLGFNFVERSKPGHAAGNGQVRRHEPHDNWPSMICSPSR